MGVPAATLRTQPINMNQKRNQRVLDSDSSEGDQDERDQARKRLAEEERRQQ